ncbi:MAG: hypothetical protein JWP89_1828 [Schlesneria sp.]|nr:hypothetical protein [Schlesneria sp.]
MVSPVRVTVSYGFRTLIHPSTGSRNGCKWRGRTEHPGTFDGELSDGTTTPHGHGIAAFHLTVFRGLRQTEFANAAPPVGLKMHSTARDSRWLRLDHRLNWGLLTLLD